MIGSERKWRRFQARLGERGFTADEIDTITCPIGVGKVSKEPTAIALAVATQLAEVLAELGEPRVAVR